MNSGREKAAGMEATTLILMGRTGNGKSSTGNSIIGRNVFKPGFSFTSTTQECQLEQTSWKDGRILKVIDTPGLFDTNSLNSTKEFFETHIAKCIELAKDGIHGVLYVVSVKNRFTPEEAGILDSLQLLFGQDIINYVVLVFTGGDELENDDLTLEDYLSECPPQLEEVLSRCNKRSVLFNNKTTSETKKEEQRTKLMNQIDNIIAKNGGKPYSNEMLRQAQENSEKFINRQTCHATSQKPYAEKELERMNAEHIKQLNSMVEEKMKSSVKLLQEELACEKQARREAQETAEKAIKFSEELTRAQMMSQSNRNRSFPPRNRYYCPFL
ncbi:hypothetical protein SUGI_0291360 [Cryptomeria japonica]|uniref:immune-associated nucleotide-binding protein 1 n=1 Tax=Cryptomeria japonica TaxID=3369 RepID=UPI002408BA6C|nr:immune-associated nucleotide-binding protein 1 [Cryptomeria japonica]GLJ16889.1 hypothetical protein SUGI_0291360 [Cryptomeria japonica]